MRGRLPHTRRSADTVRPRRLCYTPDMIDPQNIDVEAERSIDTLDVTVHARFRAAVAVIIPRDELDDNPRAIDEAKRKAIKLLSENPDAYSVGAGARAVRIPAKDLP